MTTKGGPEKKIEEKGDKKPPARLDREGQIKTDKGPLPPPPGR